MGPDGTSLDSPPVDPVFPNADPIVNADPFAGLGSDNDQANILSLTGSNTLDNLLTSNGITPEAGLTAGANATPPADPFATLGTGSDQANILSLTGSNTLDSLFTSNSITPDAGLTGAGTNATMGTGTSNAVPDPVIPVGNGSSLATLGTSTDQANILSLTGSNTLDNLLTSNGIAPDAGLTGTGTGAGTTTGTNTGTNTNIPVDPLATLGTRTDQANILSLTSSNTLDNLLTSNGITPDPGIPGTGTGTGTSTGTNTGTNIPVDPLATLGTGTDQANILSLTGSNTLDNLLTSSGIAPNTGLNGTNTNIPIDPLATLGKGTDQANILSLTGSYTRDNLLTSNGITPDAGLTGTATGASTGTDTGTNSNVPVDPLATLGTGTDQANILSLTGSNTLDDLLSSNGIGSANPKLTTNDISNIQLSSGLLAALPATSNASANNLTTAPNVSPQEARDAAAMGVGAKDLNARDAMAFKNAGVNLIEIGATPTQVKDLNQMIAAGGVRPNGSAADGTSVLVASANVADGSQLSADGTDIARLPGLGRLLNPVRVPGPGLKPNDPKFPGAGWDSPAKLNSWSTNADVNTVVSNAVRDKGSNTALNKGSNVENATREVLDNVDPFTKAGLQLKTGFKPDALYPLGGVAQNAVIAKEENKGVTAISTIRRIRDVLAGRQPEPLTATEIMAQYDKGLLPKREASDGIRVVGTTAGVVKPTPGDPTFSQSPGISLTSQSIVEAQVRDSSGKWVRDVVPVVRVQEKISEYEKTTTDLTLTSGKTLPAQANESVDVKSKTQINGQAKITNVIEISPNDDQMFYSPIDPTQAPKGSQKSWDPIGAFKRTKVETSGVAIYPSNLGYSYRGIDKFNNPVIFNPLTGEKLNTGIKFSDNGIKFTEVQSDPNFKAELGVNNILTQGFGSLNVKPGIFDARQSTGSWGPYK
jgi:hypothetical protein